MTTAAWDGKCLATDRRMSGGVTGNKLFALPNGAYMVGAGTYDDIVEVALWLQKKRRKPKFSASEEGMSEVIVVQPNGTAYWLTWPFLRKVAIREPHAAIGTGMDYALGALAAGATAKQAVQIAARFDLETGHGVDCVQVVK